jgi:hypothetical protein
VRLRVSRQFQQKRKAYRTYTVAVVVKVYEAPIVEIKKVHKLASDESVTLVLLRGKMKVGTICRKNT